MSDARPVAWIDRPWSTQWSAVAATSLKMPTLETTRALVTELITTSPDSPLSSRIDRRAGLWRRVPAGDIEAHVAALVTSGPDPDPDALGSHLLRTLPPTDSETPFHVIVGPTSLCLFLSHLVGDATVLSRIVAGLALTDLSGLVALGSSRATTRTAFIALRMQARPHYREWIAHRRSSTQPAAAAQIATPIPASAPGGLVFGDTIMSTKQLSALSKWRNANSPGTSITSLLTVASYLALRQEGIAVDATGYFALVDLRRYLPERPDIQPGNLAKALRVDADLTDPTSVEAAMEATVNSARAVPAVLEGALTLARRRSLIVDQAGSNSPASGQPVATGPVTLTFNSMPSLPRLSDMPWLEVGDRRFLAASYPGTPDSITLFALRLRHHMGLASTCFSHVADHATLQRCLAAVADAPALFDAALFDAAQSVRSPVTAPGAAPVDAVP